MGLEGHLSPQFKKFRRDQVLASERPFGPSNLHELQQAIQASRVVYLGDFHSFDQSARNVERLLRVLEGERIILGVEFVSQEFQEYLDFYLNHLITEFEFLESIQYRESWRFPWTYYRQFFELAIRAGFPIVALNSEGTLEQRDERASLKIAELLKEDPEAKVLVLFGEYHIVADKLPQKTAAAYGESIVQTIIHQNLDEVYWKMRERELDTEIIAFSENEFSLQTSPPWVKYESQIYWYENLTDDPDFDLHEYIMETGLLAFNSNISDNFYFLCQQIAEALGIEIDKGELEDFNLYDYQNLEYISEKITELGSENSVAFYQWMLEQGSGFFLPNRNIFYSSTYSINRMSYLAGIHIMRTLHRVAITKSESKFFESAPSFFINWFFVCAGGYFCSKVINPHRKCDLYLDLLQKYQSTSEGERDKVRSLSLSTRLVESLQSEWPLAPLKDEVSFKELYQCARALGYMYAERLFEGKLKEKDPLALELKDIIFNGDWSQESWQKFCLGVIPGDEYLILKKRFF